jgi:hypothetical protein
MPIFFFCRKFHIPYRKTSSYLQTQLDPISFIPLLHFSYMLKKSFTLLITKSS